MFVYLFFFFSSRRRHTRWTGDWSSDVCSSDLAYDLLALERAPQRGQGEEVVGARIAELHVRRGAVAHHRDRNLLVAQELHEIGRASCRERVEIWGGAG